jgi:hypothetical protein
MQTRRKIKCERCGFYCDAPYVYDIDFIALVHIAFINYLMLYIDSHPEPLEPI